MKNDKMTCILIGSVMLLTRVLIAQENIITPDLTKIVSGDGWRVVNRVPEIIQENGQTCVHFKATNQQGGIAWLENLEFTNGIIEVDIKGENRRGGSFLGVAFRGVNDTTYDAVYFRPFNFSVSDQNGHSVQYISLPKYTWYGLREAHPGLYENSIIPPPDPNIFFHVKIVIDKPRIEAYVNDIKESSLVVEELSDRTGGQIGLWMDFISDGTFANLKIIPAGN